MSDNLPFTAPEHDLHEYGYALPEACSDPPAESCSDAGCPVHGWDYDDE